jgi:hypothetical protein
MGVFLATTVITTVTVFTAAFIVVVAYGRPGRLDPLAAALDRGLMTGKSVTLLENEREQLILQDTDSKMFTLTSQPTITSAPAALQSGASGGAPIVPSGPPPDPSSAEGIAYDLLPSFGFSTDQFGCLNDIWSRESGWRYNAANASGAYGIPQALPGDKMASAGPDWQTDPTTQIKWGLGYIKDIYGSPCQAWVFWQDHGWY